LSGGIPNLELNALVVDFDILDFEINSDRCNERGREGVICVSEKETGFSHTFIRRKENKKIKESGLEDFRA
jgi:hypothetical protein